MKLDVHKFDLRTKKLELVYTEHCYSVKYRKI